MIIISPAKKQIETARVSLTQPDHLEKMQPLLELLSSYTVAELVKCLGISEQLAQENHQRFLELKSGQAALTPAIYTYAGDVYKHLDPESCSDHAIVYAQDHLRILSAFYGPLRPLDAIGFYRLEMITKLSGFELLVKYWQESMTQAVEDQNVFNLASEAYSKSIDRKRCKHWVDIVFYEKNKKGRYVVVAVNAKRMRGKILAYMLENQVDSPDGLEAFESNGYGFDAINSTESKVIFRKG